MELKQSKLLKNNACKIELIKKGASAPFFICKNAFHQCIYRLIQSVNIERLFLF